MTLVDPAAVGEQVPAAVGQDTGDGEAAALGRRAQALAKAAWLSADRGIAPRGDGGGGLVDGTGEDRRGVRG